MGRFFFGDRVEPHATLGLGGRGGSMGRSIRGSQDEIAGLGGGGSTGRSREGERGQYGVGQGREGQYREV